jgi:hypothetical protein
MDGGMDGGKVWRDYVGNVYMSVSMGTSEEIKKCLRDDVKFYTRFFPHQVTARVMFRE